MDDGRRSRYDRPQTSPLRTKRNQSPLRRSKSSRDRSTDRPNLKHGYSSDAINDQRLSSLNSSCKCRDTVMLAGRLVAAEMLNSKMLAHEGVLPNFDSFM